MQFGFGTQVEQLYTTEGLSALDAQFIAYLAAEPELHNRLVTARRNPESLAKKDESQLLIDIAPRLEDFLSELFGIRAEVAALKETMFALSPLFACKRIFVQRKAAKTVKPEDVQTLDSEAVLKALDIQGEEVREIELSFARAVMTWLDAPERFDGQLHLATHYAGWALYAPAGQAKHASGILFKQPRKLDPLHLVALETELRDGVTMLKIPHHHRRVRHGFALTDDGGTLEKALDEANYCIFCHNQGRDSCSTGMKEKDGSFKQSALGTTLNGCPLEEKISEMNFLRSEGVPLGALAVVIVDNPMCAGTGHRICNDCMKSCVFQKQEPVNIPQSETRALRDVLALPYGFEIYSLLTRWNPLDLRRPLPKPDTGKRVLIAGMGPAGYTLAHHLMNDGHTVVGIDGLKIEPMARELSGVLANGELVSFEPIRDASVLFTPLNQRRAGGFGGVAEYGITVRWDKNFLTVLRLLLERRRQFALIGGVRFGSTITVETAWELGFDHIALCMGAGKPTLIEMKNGLARGVRTASDFLMALQLTGAARADSIANLQLRLPAVVIGGGLTAIDTATEALAYYPVQVEKFLTRYEALVAERGEQAVRHTWSAEETLVAHEFITHARAIREERKKSKPDLTRLLNSWGGVTMAYRRKLTDAPSYRLNHEEVEKALEEGIFIAESLEPVAIEMDEFGHAKAISFKDGVTLPARAVLMAAGTQPNTVLAEEAPDHITLHGKYFQAVDEDGAPVSPERSAKPYVPQMLVAREASGRAISFFGDLHPSFAGNVVKAMGSAKQGYPVVSRMLARMPDRKAFPLEGGRLDGGAYPGAVQKHERFFAHARTLRKSLTASETKLWHRLNRNQLGVKFRRQYPFGLYVLDFVCLEAKLAVEVDGSQHAEQQAYDAKRTAFIEAEGYKILRFWNSEVSENIDDVVETISAELKHHENMASPPSRPSPLQGEGEERKFLGEINMQLRATVHDIIRLAPNIIEVVVKAPLAARMFQPGQFYRLQNFEANALATHYRSLSTTLTMEGLALTGASVDIERGLLSTIVLEMGGSSDLCAMLKPGEPVVLMGPTGEPTYIPKNQTLLLAGGGLGNAVLFSIGRAAREAGSKVLYFAGYRHERDRYKVEEIEKAADVVVWCCDGGAFTPDRAQDKTYHGNIVQGILAYAQGRMGDVPISLQEIDHLIAIGSDRMMEAVTLARHAALKPYLKPGHTALGSINSPMQCMMKEICAQCLQQHIDPATGAVTYVYSCRNQDQPLDHVSFPFLNERLKQNSVQEKLTALWVDHCLNLLGLRKNVA